MQRNSLLIALAIILACFCLPATKIYAQMIAMQANGSGGTSMAVCSSGNVQMWGNNGVGQEGTNFAASSGNGFVIVLAGEDSVTCPTNLCNITAVAAGSNYDSYALDNVGHVWSWGECQFAEMGNGSDGVIGCTQGTPVEVETASNVPLTGVSTIAAGFNTAFAIDSAFNLWGWGFNGQYGAIGNNTTNDVPFAVQVHGVGNIGFLTGITACAGGGASLAVGAGGAVYGWGLNNCGQCGSGYPTNFPYPVKVETSSGDLTNCIAVASGSETSYALDDSGYVWTWGLDNLGQGGVNLNNNAPGDGGGSSNNLAVRVGSGGCGGGVLNNIIAITAGWTNVYALDDSGHVWAWGYNANGECGIGNQNEQNCPVEVLTAPNTPLTNIVAIAGSTWEAMALSCTGVIYTWGFNSGGQLGNGTAIGSVCLYATPMTAGYCSIAPLLSSLHISGTQSSVCQGETVALNASGATTYSWSPASGLSCTTCSNPTAFLDSTITYTLTGTSGSCSVKDSVTIIVNPSPPVPVITLSQAHDTLYCSTDTSYSGYQWYADTALIPGATDTLLVISQSGNYNVRVTNKNGCQIAVGINVIILGIQNYANNYSVSLSPNPVTDKFTIYDLRFTIAQLEIYNALGQLCSKSEIVNRKSAIQIDVSSLPAGVYFVQMKTGSGNVVKRFVKE